MPFVCVDASVVLKLVLDEDDSPLAHLVWRGWWAEGMKPIAPPLLPYEIATSIRKRAHRRLITQAEADVAFSSFEQLAVAYVQPQGLIKRAFALATNLRRPTVYDCLYLATAQTYGCDFWTADERFYNAVAPHAPFVRLLANYSSTVSP
jgi:predicted nucleic acid-binding protein